MKFAPQQTRAIPACCLPMADPETWGERYPNVAGFVASGASVAAGVVVTNWVGEYRAGYCRSRSGARRYAHTISSVADVIKVRQQISENRSRNFFLTGLDVIRAEGPLGLYRGCSMAIFRGVVYGGAYRNMLLWRTYGARSCVSLIDRLRNTRALPCYITGARIGLYTPVKDLLGANSAESPLSLKISAGVLSGAVAAGVTNPTDLLKTSVQSRSKGQGGIRIAADLVRTQGIRSLWKGTTPSMVRARCPETVDLSG